MRTRIGSYTSGRGLKQAELRADKGWPKPAGLRPDRHRHVLTVDPPAGDAAQRYLPFHSAGRLPMNASIPSPASSVIMLQAITSAAYW